MNTLQTAFWSGVLATGSMTLSMFKSHEHLPPSEKSPLPPATLTRQTLTPGPVTHALSPDRQSDLTMLAHFGYGIAGALLYSLTARSLPLKPAVKGGLFGLGVWAVSYLGWIPAFGFRSNAYSMPSSRNRMMLLAHLAWGSSLGIAEERLRTEGKQMLDGRRKAIAAE